MNGGGWLRIVGLGPGPAKWLTAEVNSILHMATDVVGYQPYVEGLPSSVLAKRHPSGNGVELDRARMALQMAGGGARVAVVSGGDAGVFGMAAAVFEALEHGDPQWRLLDVEVMPGLTAVLAAAARIGAPLGHDFCVLSLSDHLKPWAIVEKRLRAASEGDFVLAIYNPSSRQRGASLRRALEQLKSDRGPETIAIVAANVGRPDEHLSITSLAALDHEAVDMRTLLIIGSSHTRSIQRPEQAPWVYTPRYYEPRP